MTATEGSRPSSTGQTVPAADAGSPASLDALVQAASALAVPGQRHLLGITGAPGSGKSTLGALLAAALAGRATLVSLDGFHLANAELHRLGLHPRKGAPETFDPAGFVSLLQRLRSPQEDVVYAPLFDRALEESLACAVPVPRDLALVLVEGNYLLLDGSIWGRVRPLLDECWYVDPGEDTRLNRLIARHESFGRNTREARDRSLGSDQRNAEIIAGSRRHATRTVRVPVLEVNS